MRLVAVFGIDDAKNYTDILPVESILKKRYEGKHDLYIDFRKKVKKGRYGLAITEGEGTDKPLFIIDTQVIEKRMN